MGSNAIAPARVLLSRLFNRRLSPINLPRFSFFATSNAPEADLKSREEGGNTHDSLQRGGLRTQARH